MVCYESCQDLVSWRIAAFLFFSFSFLTCISFSLPFPLLMSCFPERLDYGICSILLNVDQVSLCILFHPHLTGCYLLFYFLFFFFFSSFVVSSYSSFKQYTHMYKQLTRQETFSICKEMLQRHTELKIHVLSWLPRDGVKFSTPPKVRAVVVCARCVFPMG